LIKLTRIMAATDFSAAADNAVGRGAKLAASHGAELLVVHVFDNRAWQNAKRLFQRDEWAYGEPEDTANERLEDVRKRIAGDCTVRTRLLAGEDSVSNGLRQLIADEEPELLVLGARGEHWLKDLVLGSTALKLLQEARTPVLVSRVPAARPYAEILVGVDFSPACERAVRFAGAAFPSARQRLLHAFQIPLEGRMRLAGASDAEMQGFLRITRAHAEKDMQRFNASMRGDDREAGDSRVMHGPPASVLIEEAAASQVDIVALGRHGGSASDERVLGSVPDNILHYAPCDVLLVP
jgi:nucleotide-binding universal stress UspA family protein